MTVEDIVALPFSENVVSKTIQSTIKKFSNTEPSLMYSRTPVEILDNIFMGDIAKNCLIDYLSPFATKPIVDYDEIRTDDFKNADPGWDFKIGNRGIKVEVKSSIPPNLETRQTLVTKRDIKITASHDKGITMIPPENLESQIHVQVYFYAKIHKEGPYNMESLYNHINTNHAAFAKLLNINKYSNPLFFGWAGRKEIIKFSKVLKPNTWTFGRTNRVYWRCPISAAHTMPELIEIMNTY